MNTPKMVSGKIPVIGHFAEYLSKPDQLLRRGAAEQGEIFAINLMGKNIAVLTGAQAKKTFFKETDKSLNYGRSIHLPGCDLWQGGLPG